MFDYSVDILVVGGGACGGAAALAASDAGAEVLVVERDDRAGGSTGMSQGLFCAAGTASQQALGIEDNAEIFFADIMEKSRGGADPIIARTLAEESAPTYQWLVEQHQFPWELDQRFRASYGNSRQRVHGWPHHSGQDLVQLLHRRMDDAGIAVMLETRLVDIFQDDQGQIIGAALQRVDGEIEKIGCKNLILASGGFGANQAMIRRFMPEAAGLKYGGHEGSEGDAIWLAEKLGAAIGDMGSYQGYAMLAEPHGISVPPPVLVEGGIILNKMGERFVDESDDIAGMVHPLSQQPDGLGWVIYDDQIESLCIAIPELADLTALKAPKLADDAAALAALTGMEVAGVKQALAEIRHFSEQGGTDDLGRKWAGGRSFQPPYRAIRVGGALYHTQGGLEIDAQAHVRRSDGSIFPNLFAGGGAARSVSGPSSWGYLPAMGLTTALVLGRIAGQAAAKSLS